MVAKPVATAGKLALIAVVGAAGAAIVTVLLGGFKEGGDSRVLVADVGGAVVFVLAAVAAYRVLRNAGVARGRALALAVAMVPATWLLIALGAIAVYGY